MGVARDQRLDGVDEAGQPEIIGVEERDPVAGGVIEARVARARDSPIGLADQVDPRIVDCSDDVGAPIARAVVDDDDFENAWAVVESRPDGRLDERLLVEQRDDDRDPNRRDLATILVAYDRTNRGGNSSVVADHAAHRPRS